MRITQAVFVSAIILLAACSRGDNPDGLFGRGAGGIDPGAGGAGGVGAGNIPVTSPQYFTDVIGDRVLFAVDQSTLNAAAIAILDSQAGWLTQNSTGQIVIEGHADEQGTREYNIALSARRASAVRNYLVSRGIPDSRLSTVPFGKERPIEICSTEACWSKNRRAVTVVRDGLGA